MAQHDEVAIARQFVEPAGKFVHRDMDHVGQRATLEFPGLAHVDDRRRASFRVRSPAEKLGRREVADQNAKRAGAGALTSGFTTVSNSEVTAQAPGALKRKSLAVIAGASPTIANTRPPGFNWR